MRKTELLKILNKIAPLELADDWDNCGMQLDFGKTEIDKVFVAMELSGSVVEAAKQCGADMIITHHPIFLKSFAPVKLTAANVNHRNVFELIRSGIEVYSSHTCFDIAQGGNNDYLCGMLGIKDVEVIDYGLRVGRPAKPTTLAEFENQVFEVLGKPAGFVASGDPDKKINKIALCTGGADDFWETALASGVDVYLTGEMEHHKAILARQTDMAFIAAGHAGTEWIFVPNMAEQLKSLCKGQLEVISSTDHQVPYDRAY